MGNYLIEIIMNITNLIKSIFQWFFDTMNSNELLKWILLLLVSISLINVVINLLIGNENDNENEKN